MDYSKFQIVEDMSEVTHIFRQIFDGRKTYGTDTAKMGFFHDQVLAAKIDGNKIIFALPFNGPIALLRETLEQAHYNKTNSIMVDCDINDDNTILIASFYTRELKLFMDL